MAMERPSFSHPYNLRQLWMESILEQCNVVFRSEFSELGRGVSAPKIYVCQDLVACIPTELVAQKCVQNHKVWLKCPNLYVCWWPAVLDSEMPHPHLRMARAKEIRPWSWIDDRCCAVQCGY